MSTRGANLTAGGVDGVPEPLIVPPPEDVEGEPPPPHDVEKMRTEATKRRSKKEALIRFIAAGL
jgi:hypothetical protein